MRETAEDGALRADGVLLLDKPAGMSSNQALQRVRRVFGGIRAGHCGTLDPAATGLLPICLGRATRIAGLLTGSRKHYLATLQLGVETDTGDGDGRVIGGRQGPWPSDEEVLAALAAFEGARWQVPPIFSALKSGGEPLYRKARRGELVQPAAREVEVYRLRLLARPQPDRLQLAIACGPGFYVRALARDLGRHFGCGAYLAALRRTEVGRFSLQQAVSLEQLEELARREAPTALARLLLSLPEALADLPRIVLTHEEALRLVHGQPPARRWPNSAPLALALDERGCALAVLERRDGGLGIRRLLVEAAAPGTRRTLSRRETAS